MTKKLSGILIFCTAIFSIFAYFFNINLLVASLFGWLAFLISYNSIQNKKILNIFLSLSLILFIICHIYNFHIDFYKIFTINQYLLTLLISVGFLRLIAIPKKNELKELPKGKKSFVKTYLGVHLFGSVINLSALILVADKMYKKAKLTNTQIVLLTRAFASDAYWSPLFVAFAAASTYAPKLITSIIIVNGLFLAFMGFIFTYHEISTNKSLKIEEFRGYPISLNALYLPFFLAFLVLIINHYYPNIQVIVLISLLSFLLTFTTLPIKNGLRNSFSKIKNHIFEELSNMKNEISLFLVAGMFGVLASSILIGLNLDLPFEKFDWIVASILLVIFIALAFIGVHPIITIAIIGDFFANENHTLLAATFLMAWSTTVSTSPFSGLNLTISARYNFSGKEILKLNILYVIKLYFICVISLFILSKILNI